MVHIKKMVMHGFKSFASKTEIQFENDMNVIVGPNGSGKSNITDALCFVLGRLSIKSIRAAKAANLIFSGNKHHKAAQEASVELIFSNEENTFNIPEAELTIKRIVRRSGQSIYRINNQTKTRQELLELMAQAGIDPNGFNIVLQGEIASFVKMNAEERRKVIEEVAGISIYETRKHKSIRELEKTEARLQEISAILRERNSYLRNLEKEKQEAESYQRLELTIKRCKATILIKTKESLEKDLKITNDQIENQNKQIGKIKTQIKERQEEITQIEENVNKIGRQIQSSTSIEQENLHKDISELKADIAGLEVRKENFESRLQENLEIKTRSQQKVQELEQEIQHSKSASPKIKKQQDQLKKLQENLDTLEKQRREFYRIKSELSTAQNTKLQTSNTNIEIKKEIELIERSISTLSEEIKYEKSPESNSKLKQQTKERIEKLKEELKTLQSKLQNIEKQNILFSQTIRTQEELKRNIPKLDICPLCQNKITESHIKHVIEDANTKINNSKSKLKQNLKLKERAEQELNKLLNEIEIKETKLNEIEIDLIKLNNADEKKQQIKQLTEKQEQKKSELRLANEKIHQLQSKYEKLKNIEEIYDDARLKAQELSFAEVDVDSEVSMKQRDLTRIKIELKAVERNIEGSEHELKKININLDSNKTKLNQKEKAEHELYEKFKKLLSDKNEMQDKQKAIETTVVGLQHNIHTHENSINNYKIEKAQTNAKIESIEIELKEFESLEPISQPIEQIREKLQKSQMRISNFGSINSRALEIYDKIKEQVEQIQERVEIIEKEQGQVTKIIAEIDKKKKKAFMQTLQAVNQFFTRNFTQLSRKGEVFLDLENKQDPFSAGLNIILKVARGKYFDVSSLSGGEKTLVALSLIFSIQEYKPYCFYVFDEIDAALDKHNSELLAALIRKYMISGQYIIVTHNDALITEASTLYGVSMQENISKIISLKI